MKILIVDDDPQNLKLLQTQLRREGHQAVPAADGVEALARLESEPVDAIISDILMPRMDGYRLCHELRKDERWRGLPFIFYSSTYTASEDERLALELGGNGFVRKPAPASVLFEALNGAVARAHGHPLAVEPVPRRELELMQGYSQRLVAKLEDKNLELAERTEQLRALAARMENAREDERTTIAREIHDEFGEVLTGMKLGLAWVRNRLCVEGMPIPLEEVLAKIDSLGALADSTAGRVRNLCASLRPSVLDDFGLLPAIQWQAKEFQTRTGIRCEVRQRLGETAIRDEQATALFRMFQETLTNVARHAGASQVGVTLELRGANLLLRVRDDGRGIRPGEIAGHKSLGLLGMRERAALLGGTLEIQGAAGKGTTVLISLPLAQAVSQSVNDVQPKKVTE